MAYLHLKTVMAALGMAFLLGLGSSLAQDRENPEEFYWQADYADLTEIEKRAMAVLGWTEERWDSDDVADFPDSEVTEWAGLTPEQQEALASLGYTDGYWNDTRPRRPESDVDAFWAAETDWSAMRPAERALWGKLGWGEDSWADPSAAPATFEQPWGELTDEERRAADRLGYDQESWDSRSQ